MKLLLVGVAIISLSLAGCASHQAPLEQELASFSADSLRASMTLEDRLAMAHEAWIEAISLDLRGQPQLALDQVQLAALYDPDDRSLNVSLARRLREFRRSAEALVVLRRALRQSGPQSALEWELAAGLWLEAGEKDSADWAWTKVLILDPHSREAMLGKASLAESKNDLGAAAHYCSLLADEFGPHAMPWIERAEAYWLKLGRADSVQALLQRRWSDFRIPAEGEKLARYYGSFGKTKEAIALFDTLALLEPEDAQKFSLFSARFLLAAGHRYEALSRFRQILKDDPTSVKAKASVGAVLLDLDSVQAADQVFRQIIQADSTDATAWYFLGLAAQRTNQIDSARTFLDKSIQHDPKAIETWIRRGMLEIETDSLRLASQVFARMVEVWPNLAQARFLSGYTLARLAHRELRHPEREINPPDSEPVATIYRKLAVAQLDSALRIDSMLQRARFERGSLLERLGMFEQALVDLRIAVQLNPSDANTANYLGYLLADHDRFLPESDSLIQHALATDPDNPAFLDSRAWLRFHQGRAAEALADLDKIPAKAQKDPTIRQHRARILEALGRLPEAMEVWKILLIEDPNDPVNQSNRLRLKIR